jgi:UDP:flavonoid glycosyltransferase YjiC (YdhE family)
LIPLGGEQLDVAELCESIGVAKILDPRNVSAESIRDSVQELLVDDRYRQRAGRYGAALSKVDSLERAADLLEELAVTGKPVLRGATPVPYLSPSS